MKIAIFNIADRFNRTSKALVFRPVSEVEPDFLTALEPAQEGDLIPDLPLLYRW
jgi:hypothetical protein